MTHWEEIYRRFVTTRPVEGLDRKVLTCLNSLDSARPVLVACSGGADSVYLLLTLYELFEGDASRLRVVHFNHGLRGAESDADASFVEALASDLGLACEVGFPPGPLESDEASLRTARFAWIDEVYHETGAAALALGHHGDDLVESLLMGILSGAGPSGLASPMPVRQFPNGEVRLRPLLRLKRRDIEKVLSSLDIPWREDSSNANTDYTRNWLRKEILPKLQDRFPQDIHAAGLRTRELMEEAITALDDVLTGLGLDISQPKSMDVRDLIGRSRGLVRRALTGWWLKHYPEHILQKASADSVVTVIHEGKTGSQVSIGKGPFSDENQTLLLNSKGLLTFAPERSPCNVIWDQAYDWEWESGSLQLPDGATLTGIVVSWDRDDPAPYLTANPANEVWLAGVESPLCVRQWLPGDKYKPLGAPGRRKLHDLFIDAKLDAEQKQVLPVILYKNDIIWVPGFAPANLYKVCVKSNWALKLTYDRQSSPFPLNYGGQTQSKAK